MPYPGSASLFSTHWYIKDSVLCGSLGNIYHYTVPHHNSCARFELFIAHAEQVWQDTAEGQTGHWLLYFTFGHVTCFS